MGRNDNGVQKAIQKIGVTALYGARRVSIVPKSSKNLFIWLYIWLNGHVRRTGLSPNNFDRCWSEKCRSAGNVQQLY